MIEAYKQAIGFVITYKQIYESYLFNELNMRCQGIKRIDSGNAASVFTVSDYLAVLTENKKEAFIFLQHIHPYLCKVEIKKNSSDFQLLIENLNQIQSFLSKEDKLTCQCRIAVSDMDIAYSNVDLTNCISQNLQEAGYTISPQEAEVSVSVTVFHHYAYIGLSYLKDNVSDWTGGVLFYAKTEDIICRSEFKIEEAFKFLDLKLETGMRVLDLGAAPGGWTHYAALQGAEVDAVDPAELEEAVLKLSVKHHKITAQQFSASHDETVYDMIINDMKMDINESIDILCDISKLLKKDGSCLITLKLPKKEIMKQINTAKKVFGKKFEIVKIKHLYYNRSEVTIFLKNRKIYF